MCNQNEKMKTKLRTKMRTNTKTKIGKQPALLETSKTMCIWAGSIQVDDPGTKKINIK